MNLNFNVAEKIDVSRSKWFSIRMVNFAWNAFAKWTKAQKKAFMGFKIWSRIVYSYTLHVQSFQMFPVFFFFRKMITNDMQNADSSSSFCILYTFNFIFDINIWLLIIIIMIRMIKVFRIILHCSSMIDYDFVKAIQSSFDWTKNWVQGC